MAAAFALTFWSCAASVHGRIFREQGLTSTGWAYSTGGRDLYRAAFSINGGPASVSVIRTAKDMQTLRLVLPSWRNQSSGTVPRGGAIGFAEVRQDDRAARLVALADPQAQGTTIVAVEKNSLPPAGVKEWPAFEEARVAYRNSLVRGVFRNLDSGTSACLADTRDTPEQVLKYYESSLSRQGWERLPGGSSRSGDGGLQGFARRNALIWVLSRKTEYDGITRITLIHKQVAMGGR